jgi:hypothetical protein
MGAVIMKKMPGANYKCMTEAMLALPAMDELINIVCAYCESPTLATLGPADILPI